MRKGTIRKLSDEIIVFPDYPHLEKKLPKVFPLSNPREPISAYKLLLKRLASCQQPLGACLGHLGACLGRLGRV